MEILKKKIEEATHLYKVRKFNEAKIKCEDLIKKNPKISFLHNLMGLILTALGNNDKSIKYFNEGIRINPNDANLYNNLGTAYKIKNDYKKSENLYKKSISINNKLPEAYNNLGNLYIDLKKYKNAITCFNNSISVNPNFLIGHYNLGLLYKSIGKFKSAKSKIEEVMKLNINFYPAHRVYSQLNKYLTNDAHLKVMENLHRNKKIDYLNKTELCFALGKAHDDIKNFKKAFNYYSEGNALRRQNVNFFLNAEKKEFLEIKKVFDEFVLKNNDIESSNSNKPIFIIGMPRSGTTLVEQIISSHSEVYGAGELDIFNTLIKKKIFINKNNNRKLLLKNSKIFKDIGNYYLNEINIISDRSNRVTDKLPVNFKWTGLIKLIFPNSIIVHCTRNINDTCLSIYKNYFTNNELNYAYNFNEILDYYELYEDLMNFWKIKLNNKIIELKYENLVNNPEKEIKKLIKNCDLKRDKSCLDFHKNNRAIKTASDMQVRNKMYTTSISAWKNYEKYFEKRLK